MFRYVDNRLSDVGVLDKAVAVLDAVADAPRSLAELVAATGLPRATAHRLAVALEAHGLLRRDGDGRFALGLRLAALGRAAAAGFPLVDLARPALERLRDGTGESVQLYVLDADGRSRRCVASLDSPSELRTIVPVGAVLPLDRGSAGKVLAGAMPARGWLESVGEREPGVASVSAPVVGPDGAVVAAVSVSGPIQRTTRQPGRRYGAAVVGAAAEVGAALA
jgi:DNA-binding IclR family transcriptional regulator